jgi:hypothetical protein
MMPGLDIEEILTVFNRIGVRYLLIGGVNYALRHDYVITVDIDFWVEDTAENLAKINNALRELKAEWGPSEHNWRLVPEDPAWLKRQSAFCLTTPLGPVDIFRSVFGLENQFEECYARSLLCKTPRGIRFQSLSDQDMLQCQEVLDSASQKLDRMKTLRAAIEQKKRQ